MISFPPMTKSHLPIILPFVTGKINAENNTDDETLFFTDAEGTAVTYGLHAGNYRLNIPGYAGTEFSVTPLPGTTDVRIQIDVVKNTGE